MQGKEQRKGIFSIAGNRPWQPTICQCNRVNYRVFGLVYEAGSSLVFLMSKKGAIGLRSLMIYLKSNVSNL